MIIDEVPVIDLSGDQSVVVKTLDHALRKFGFFYVTGAGIPSELVAAQFDIASKLFQLPIPCWISAMWVVDCRH
jgi:isopenicillin N synthase-like dioxygenase